MTALQQAGPSQFVIPPYWMQTPPLTQDRSVYVDSVNGSDTTGEGTQSRPWQSYTRMYADRNRFGQLRAKYTANLLGPGPYTVPALGFSDCGIGGYFVTKGDTAAETILATGTFTGDINTAANQCIVTTTAGVGAVNSRIYEFLRITSGPYAGAVCQIVANTDTSITVAMSTVRTTIGSSWNGLTFQIFRPGTELRPVTSTTGQPIGIQYWQGGMSLLGNGSIQSNPRHLFYNCRFTTQLLAVSYSFVGFVACRFDTPLYTFNSQVMGGFVDNGSIVGVGANGKTDFVLAAGVSIVNQTCIVAGPLGSAWNGVFSGSGSWFWSFSSGPSCAFMWDAGRIDATMTMNAGYLSSWGTLGRKRTITRTISLQNRSYYQLFPPLEVAVTTGSFVVANEGSKITQNTQPADVVGGTTDPAGYAFDIRNGGQFSCGAQPAITGGTAGQDIRMTSAAFPNSSFAAAGSVIGAASDNARGEFAYRK